MAGGGADGTVRIHIHDIQITERKYLGKGAELVIHQFQQLISHRHHVRQRLVIIPAPGGHALIGHGDKVHILYLQTAKDSLLRKPQDILEGKVRGHILLKHLGKLIDFGHVLDLEHLLDNRFQESLLGLDTADITVGIAILAVPEPDHTHGLLTVKLLIALADMDGQILIGILVVHIPGHIKVHTANGVHDLAHSFPFHDNTIVRLEAHQLRDLLIQGIDALLSAAVVVVDGVDLLHIPVHVHHGVPGDGHDCGFLIGHVIGCQQHGVRVAAAAGIPAQDQHGIEVLALAFAVADRPNTVAIVHFLLPLVAFALIFQVRTYKQGTVSHCYQQDQGQHYTTSHHPFLLAGQS